MKIAIAHVLYLPARRGPGSRSLLTLPYLLYVFVTSNIFLSFATHCSDRKKERKEGRKKNRQTESHGHVIEAPLLSLHLSVR